MIHTRRPDTTKGAGHVIDVEDDDELTAAMAYLSALEPQERSEEQGGDDLRLCERYDGPFDDDAPASIRGATLVYLYTNYKLGSDEIESQELDIYGGGAGSD